MIEETLCPDCNGKMVPRNGPHGKFWGCKNYPECKGTRDSEGRSKRDRATLNGDDDYESDKEDKTQTNFTKTTFRR